MARYKDVDGYRKLFDEEYKKTRELIFEGEIHLDNLAEGFSEASRVIDSIPTADVVPKSEVEKLIKSVDDMLDLVCAMTGLDLTYFGKYAELKKKYVKDCRDCRYFVGCETACGGRPCDGFEAKKEV